MFVDGVHIDVMNSRGEGGGNVGAMLQQCHYDPGYMKPYIDERGVPCVDIITGARYDNERRRMVPVKKKRPIGRVIANGQYSPAFNATALRKDEWIELDRVVVRAARSRLRAYSDLRAANSFGGFNAMAKTLLEHETMSDPGEAVVDMDGLSEGRGDQPRWQLEGLPLPITHSDFYISRRKLAESRNSGTPLDTTMAEAAGRRVSEMIEKTTIGTVTGLTYGNATDYGRTPTVYGMTNFPARVTKTDVTTPTGSNPDATVADVLALRSSLFDANFFGPYMLYHSTDWDQYLDDDYVTGTAAQGLAAPSSTLRQRLREIEGIQDVRRLDFLTSTFTLILIQMTADVARAVNGMDVTTVQWESKGGMQINFKVMAIQVPQFRADYSGNCGIAHGTTS